MVYLTVGGDPLLKWLRSNARLLLGVGLAVLVLLGFALPRRPQVRFGLQRTSKTQGLEPPQPEVQRDDDPSQNPQERAKTLRMKLAGNYGFWWRHRARLVLIAADEAQVRRLAPELARNGYAVTPEVVLLYARQNGDILETAWLDQIRRLRRSRPVDAIVALAQRNLSPSRPPFDADDLMQCLGCHARALKWSAPVYVLDATDFDRQANRTILSTYADEAIGFTWSNPRVDERQFDTSLRRLSANLADRGVLRLSKDACARYPAELSQHIETWRESLLALVVKTTSSRFWRHHVYGLLFAPFPAQSASAARGEGETAASETFPVIPHDALWQAIASHSRKVHGKPVGFSFLTTAAWAWVVTGIAGAWFFGAIVSGCANHGAMVTDNRALARLSAAQDSTQAMQVLDALDRQIDTLETRQRNGAPLTTRFGLNHDRARLDALWPAYAAAADRILAGPLHQALQARLQQVAAMSDAELASGGDVQVQSAYDTLKAYLMLASSQYADAPFLRTQLLATGGLPRPFNSSLTPGAWDDLRQHTVAFLASHLGEIAAHGGALKSVAPDAALVAATRQSIISVRGLQNSSDTLYQQILDGAKPKYPDVTLGTLLGNTSSKGLFSTDATIPGMFTRHAWDERIEKAIAAASTAHDAASDWVLSDMKADGQPLSGILKNELRQRYLEDYARAWELFLNSLRWQPASTLSGTVDQLALLGDPQRSPLVALMNAIVYQANAAADGPSLSDTLVGKARQLVGSERDPSKPSQSQPQQTPLQGAFGPILRLTGSGQTGAAANGGTAAQQAAANDLSFARYLERITAMRLKVQQMMASADTDASARSAAQAVLQGRTSDMTDSSDYASRVAASLGEQWAGLGDLLQAPLDQTLRVVLQPAFASLNDAWRDAVVADWNRTFGGRYPFADSQNNASLPEMARFMRPDGGVIARFISAQLAGVIERQGDHWVAAPGAANRGALTLEPGFLAALNRMLRASTVLFASSDARIGFELRGVATPGITDVKLASDGYELHYFNQKEEWIPFQWPGQSLENFTHLEWQSQQAGLRSMLDEPGPFGLIRLLERAQVTPLDNARYLLTWTSDAGQDPLLRVQMRSDAGEGPLAVLQLRHFMLPSRIFVASASGSVAHAEAAAGPPPLPPSAIEAAKHAVVSLPGGR